MVITVYRADVRPLCDASLFEKYFDMIPEWRKDAVDTLSRERPRRLSLGASVLLAEAMRDFGADPGARVVFGKNGKPLIEGGNDFYFNLSHSGEYAVCAAARAPVGCDVEAYSYPDYRIARRFFTDAENDFVSVIEDEEKKRRAFYGVWTRKEAVLKADGDGFLAGHSAVSLEGERGFIVYKGKTYYVASGAAPEGYALAYSALTEDEPDVVYKDILLG